ncbi:hypothetical protein [Ekhidna sp.]|uniref:hypothetical protein n=1 Tax=Ekhidna sp. TaxID=2608089 RepID=UPI003512BB27
MKERIEKLIDEALKMEPTFQLRKDFKDKVVLTIRKKEKANQRRLYLWMTFGTLIIFGFGYGTIAYFIPEALQNFGNMASWTSQLIPIAVLVGLLVLVIQYLDKRLVKDKMFHA